MVVREPITVVVSEKGWIRGLRGHVTDLSGVGFKTDDSLKFAFATETTAMSRTDGPCASAASPTPPCKTGSTKR